MFRHPRIPDCTTCQKYVIDYDWETGVGSGLPEKAKWSQDPNALHERPEGNKPPCNICPKRGPEHEREFILSRKNLRTLKLWQETRSTYGRGLSEREAADAMLRKNFATLDRLWKELEREQQGEVLATAVYRALRKIR